jgi:hypothetical protein
MKNHGKNLIFHNWNRVDEYPLFLGTKPAFICSFDGIEWTG